MFSPPIVMGVLQFGQCSEVPSQSLRWSEQNILAQHRVRHGLTAVSRQIPQSRSASLLFLDVREGLLADGPSLVDDEVLLLLAASM